MSMSDFATQIVNAFFHEQDQIVPTTRLEEAMKTAIESVLTDGPWVVGYWGNVSLITFDYNEAAKRYADRKANYTVLPFDIRTVRDAIQHAYESGVADGRSECEDD